MKPVAFALILSALPATAQESVDPKTELQAIVVHLQKIEAAMKIIEAMPDSADKTALNDGLQSALQVVAACNASAEKMRAAAGPEFTVGDQIDGLTLLRGRKFDKVTITALDAAAVTVSHPGGIIRILISDLSPEWQARFAYDPAAAAVAVASYEARQAPVRAAAAQRAAANQERVMSQTVDMAITPEVTAKIQAAAREKWAGDFSMQKYEIEKQSEAYLSLIRMKKVGDVPADVIQAAFDKWGDDFNMVVYEIEKQMTSRRSLVK